MSATTLETALAALSEAHGPAALLAAFRQAKRAVRVERRQDGEAQTLGRIVMEAVAFSEEWTGQGMVRQERDAAIERVLRATWPKPHNRTEPWRDQCESCRDYGLQMARCPGDARCGRTKDHGPHEYGSPCWCPAGRRHQEKPERTPEDVMDRAAKQRKPTRFGR